MTTEQQDAIVRIQARWSRVGSPQMMIGGHGAIVVSVGGTEESPSIWLAIEPDGHTHS